MSDFRSLGRAMDAVRRAKEGDDSILMARLRDSSVRLEELEREYIAGRLDGTIKHKRGPKPHSEALLDALTTKAIFDLHFQRGAAMKAATALTAEACKIAASTVHKRIQKADEYLKVKRATNELWLGIARAKAEEMLAPISRK